MGAIARDLGQEAGWAETGYAAPAPRVVYGSRRRGSAFGPHALAPRALRPVVGAPRQPGQARRRPHHEAHARLETYAPPRAQA